MAAAPPWAPLHDRFRSPSADAEYVISVSVPGRHDRTDDRYPLIVVLDARWMFGTVADAVMSMSMGGELPEALVVGVGYPETSLRELVQRRAIDYTPTAAPAPAETGVRVPADQLGGAGRFRVVLVEEIVPFVAERWRTDGDLTLVGHSFSGLFALDTLLRTPQSFDRYLLASPSIWWDDRSILGIEEELAAGRDDLAARVFVSAGTAEMEDEPFRMSANVNRLVETLRSRCYPSLELEHRRLEGETHHSTPGSAVSAGLRWLHATSPPR